METGLTGQFYSDLVKISIFHQIYDFVIYDLINVIHKMKIFLILFTENVFYM